MSNKKQSKEQAIEFLIWLVSALIFSVIAYASVTFHFWKTLVTVIGITIICALEVIRNGSIK